MASVIVFGPTGQIGSAAAKTALEQGAKVWLAMRDTSKVVPGLENDQEAATTIDRVQADLQKPETVKHAVEASGAKRAFIYLAHGSSDSMRATIEALKSGGVEFVGVCEQLYHIHEPKLTGYPCLGVYSLRTRAG